MLAVNVPPAAPPAARADRGAAKSPAREAPDPWQDGHALGAEALFRGGSRLGDAGFTSDIDEKGGLGFELGAWFRLAPEYALGFQLERRDLGNVSFTSGQSTVNAGYNATALELGGRAYPFRWDGAELFLGLEVGLAWQGARATGLRPSVNLEPATVYRCSDTSGPGFALGAQVGGSLRLTRAFWLTGGFGADGYSLSSDAVGECVGGIGSITALSAGAGLIYAFDLGREAKL